MFPDIEDSVGKFPSQPLTPDGTLTLKREQ